MACNTLRDLRRGVDDGNDDDPRAFVFTLETSMVLQQATVHGAVYKTVYSCFTRESVCARAHVYVCARMI